MTSLVFCKMFFQANMSRVFSSELVSGMIQTWTAVSKTFILKVSLGSDAFALSRDSGKCHLPKINMSVLGQVVLCGFLFCFLCRRGGPACTM